MREGTYESILAKPITLDVTFTSWHKWYMKDDKNIPKQDSIVLDMTSKMNKF